MDGLSLIIPTYNRARLLSGTLESVLSLRIPAGLPIELVVIDNNCSDETPEVVRAASHVASFSVRRVLESRQGLCHCRNRAIQEAAYSHLGYLDDDIRIAADWIEGLMEAVESFGADCVVGPVSPLFEVPPNGSLTAPVLALVTSDYSRKGDQAKLLGRDEAWEVPGSNFSVCRAVAKDVGGFDPNLDRCGSGLLAGGDTEFGMRLVSAGKRVVYQPRCAIQHLITAEKMTRGYLRRRSHGAGATQRALRQRHLWVSSPISSWQGLCRVVRLAASFCRFACIGDEPRRFEKELKLRYVAGYMMGPRG